jgi:hypothetical protein
MRERQAANAYVQSEIAEAQARRAADGSTDQHPMAGIMARIQRCWKWHDERSRRRWDDGHRWNAWRHGRSPMSSNLVDTGSAIAFERTLSRLSLNSQLFNLTDEQRAAVNAILKETHERYLKEEALHSIVSVDA